MKNSLFCLLALFFSLSTSRADWLMVQKNSMEGQEQVTTMKIKDGLARVDVGTESSVIMNGENIMIVMHPQKMIMKMDPQMLEAAMKGVAQMAGQSGGQAPAKPVATGQKEKVGEWNTEIYTWEGPMGKGRFWVDKDFPQAAEIAEASDKIGKAMGDPVAAFSPKMSDFSGMVVKSEMTVMGKVVVSELVSAKEEKLDAKDFAAPEGYKEMKMPAMPGAPQK